MARPKDEIFRALERGRRQPDVFIEQVLRRPLWDTQRQVVRATFADYARVAWKAAPSTGKTYTAASIVLAFFLLYPKCKILTTAPSWTAVESLLWGEIRGAWEKLPLGIGAKLTTTRIDGGANWWAMGLSTDIEERFKGHHAAHILIVVDESPAIRPAIWKAIDAVRAGGNVRVLILGNPTAPLGEFYAAFGERSHLYTPFTTSAFDSPNLAGVSIERLLEMGDDELSQNLYPNLTTRRWVREAYEELGPEHPMWQANVLAQFPTQAENALLSLAWIELAAKTIFPPEDDDEWQVGIDVAGEGEVGDETSCHVRRGRQVVAHQAWRKKGVQGECVNFLLPFREHNPIVLYDSIGVGQYFATPLKEAGFRCVPVNVGLPAHDKTRFKSLKAELYWGFKEQIHRGDVGGLTDRVTRAQLSTLRGRYNSTGQLEIVPKEEMLSKHGCKSPDRAESLILCFGRSKALKLEQPDPLKQLTVA